MLEPDVTISDGILGLMALAFAFGMSRVNGDPVCRRSAVTVFAALAASAWLGGIWHGFFSDDSGGLSVLIWRLTMLAVGVTAYGFAVFGMHLFAVPANQSRWRHGFQLVLAAYALALLFSDEFWLAVLIYVPAAILALAGLLRIWRRIPSVWPGVAGLVLVFVASAVQQWGPDLHPKYLTHNTLYHLVLMAALPLFYLGAKRLAEKDVHVP